MFPITLFKHLIVNDTLSLTEVFFMFAVYTRVSTDDQAERGTIESQIEFAKKYCDLHKYEIYNIYKDNGVSGTIPFNKRPEGSKLIEAAKKGLFSTVLIYKLDRLGRSVIVTLNIIDKLEKLGIKIISMTEPFDTSTPTGRFMINTLANVSDLERSTILERMWIGANRAAEEGKWLGGIVPYGYTVKDGYLAINDEKMTCGFSEADVIKMMYSLYVNDKYSTLRIAQHLNSLNIPTRYAKANRTVLKNNRKQHTANTWRQGRIRNMIVSTTYKGIHQYGKRSTKNRDIIEREVPAIIDEDTWNKAQQQLIINRNCSTRNKKNRDYLLTGLLFCGQCGKPYYGFSYYKKYKTKPPEFKAYYKCYGKVNKTDKDYVFCDSKNVDANKIEEYVWNECVELIKNPSKLESKLDKGMRNTSKDKNSIESEILQLQEAIKNIEVEKDSILDLYRKKIIYINDVKKQLEKIEDEKLHLQLRLNDIKKSQLALSNKLFIEHINLFNTLINELENLEPNQKKYITESVNNFV